MPENPLVDRLDRALEALLRGAGGGVPGGPEIVDPEVAPLLEVAYRLRDLPRPDFRARLKSELERSAFMSTDTLQGEPLASEDAGESTPAVQRAVTPYLVVQDAPAQVEFLRRTFGAEELNRAVGSAGGLHAELRIGNSILMLGGGSPGLAWRGASRPMALHVYVEDVDRVFERAVGAGGTVTMPPTDHDYGERSAVVVDAEGNHWYIATATGAHFVPKGLHSVNPFLHPLKADPLIEFLTRAFGATDVQKYTSPDGVVRHAALHIGDSAIEMGEAHGPYQPMRSMFYVTVPDVDAAYRRALEAGATSIQKPADQTYGVRSAGVEDAFGHQWYLASPLSQAPA